MNLAELLLRSGRADTDQAAIALGPNVVSSYGDLLRQTSRLAGGLRRGLDLKVGDRVALVMKNCPEYVTALFAAWWGGLAAVPINAKLHGKEIDYILGDSGAKLCLATGGLASGVNESAAVQSGACRLIEIGDGDWAGLLSGPEMPPHAAAPEEMAWLFYTSGTTGQPKGAMLSHRSLYTMTACYFMDVDTIARGDSLLHAAPMSHGSGIYILPHVAAAATQVIPESGGFEPDEIFHLLRAHRGVSFFAAPTMVHRLCNAPGAEAADRGNLKTIVYGGGPMYVADCKRALAVFGNRLVQIYGQGETPMTITALSKARHGESDHPDYEARLASVGTPQSLVEVRIFDSEGKEAASGETGEVVVRGPSLMTGYWRRPEATAEAIRDGWLYTGDIGAFGADGFLTLKDRSKDVIISGGSNIYPREVEEALLLHPKVREVSVIGEAHADWGETVVACIVADDVGHPPGEAELNRHCGEQIARFKRPKRYLFLNELPKNNYGKVVKTELRARLKG